MPPEKRGIKKFTITPCYYILQLGKMQGLQNAQFTTTYLVKTLIKKGESCVSFTLFFVKDS